MKGATAAVAIPNPPPLPTYLSPSAIKEYLTCPRKYYYSRILKLEKPVTANLHLGKTVHEAIRFFNLAIWRGEEASGETVLATYDTLFPEMEEAEGPVEFKDPDHRQEVFQAGRNLLEAFLKSEAAAHKEKPVGVEVRVKECFDQAPLPLLGILDYIRPANIPVDYKTIGSTPNLENETWSHQIQLTAYQLLVERATGDKVPGLELVFLVKNKKPKVIRHRISPADPIQIDRFWEMVRAVTEGLKEGRFHPQPGIACSWCPFRNECSTNHGGIDA